MRIAPNEGQENHFECVTWLNSLIIALELAKAGEPNELTLGMLGKWRLYRQEIAECRHAVISWTPLNDHSMYVKTAKHAAVLQQVGQIITQLESMWTWPPPKDLPNVDLAALRRCRDELQSCRSEQEVKC